MDSSTIIASQRNTIDAQQKQIDRLTVIVMNKNSSQNSDQQLKYQKVIAQLSLVIKANKSLKQQVDSLKKRKSFQSESGYDIQRDQFEKAYQKVLNQKSQLASLLREKQSEIEKLRYSVYSMEEYVAELKSEQLALNRQKQSLQRKVIKNYQNLNASQRQAQSQNGSALGGQFQVLKARQNQFDRMVGNYQKAHASLSRKNKQLEDRINQLQSFIEKNQEYHKQNERYLFIKARNEVENQMKQQISQAEEQNNFLRNKHSQLLLKLEKNAESLMQNDPENSANQLLLILAELYNQMNPIKTDIESINKDQSQEYLQMFRQKQSIKIKLLEKDSEIKKLVQLNKELERKILTNSNELKKLKQFGKKSNKSEQINKLLEEKVLGLQSNLSLLKLQDKGVDLNQEVRLQKQIIGKSKSLDFLQTVALQTYIIELDTRNKQLRNQIRMLRQETTHQKIVVVQLQEALKRSQSVQCQYRKKLQGYDQLIKKMQSELQKRLQSNKQIQTSRSLHYVQSRAQISHLKKCETLEKKLQDQKMLYETQIRNIKSSYQAKMMSAVLTTTQIADLKNANRLYRKRNQQLMKQINQKQNELLQIKTDQSRGLNSFKSYSTFCESSSDQFITQLHITSNEKQIAFMRLQIQLKDMNKRWSEMIHKFEQENNSLKHANTKNAENHADESFQKLQQSLSRYKVKVLELEQQISKLHTSIANSAIKTSNNNSNQDLNYLYQNKLKWKDHQILILNNQVAQLRSGLKELQFKDIQIKELKETVLRMRSHMEQIIIQNSKSSQIAKVRGLIDLVSVQAQQKNSLIYQLKEQIRNYKKQIDELKGKIFIRDIQLNQFNKNVSVNNIQSEHLEREWILKLQQDLAGAKFRISTNQSEIKERDKIIQRLHEQVLHFRIYGLTNNNTIDIEYVRKQLNSRLQSARSSQINISV